MFDATYIINLARSPERWQALQPILSRMEVTNVIRFDAIDGEALGVQGISGLQAEDRLSFCLERFDANSRPGEIGCALSHAGVLADIVEKGWKSALILEDDIALAPPADAWRVRMEQAFADLPADWELWYLYRCFDIRHRVQRITPRIVVPWTPQGGAAYAVTLNGAKRLLAALTPAASAVDRVFADLVRSRAIRAYAASPMLILPGMQPSMINRGNSSREWVEDGVNLPPEYWPDTHVRWLGEETGLPLHRRLAARWNRRLL